MRYGWVKDPEDQRDYSAVRLITKEVALPEEYIVDMLTPVYQQGDYPACVGFSAAGIKTDQEFLQRGERIIFDGLWLYEQCKKVDGDPLGEGTYPRVALKIMKDKGMKKKGSWCVSKKWKISAFYRVPANSSIDFVKQVIYQFGSIMMGSMWYESWNLAGAYFPEPDYECGGHAYRINGWTDIGFVVTNSWGTEEWGMGGVSVMPYSMFMDVLKEGDCWKLVDYVY